MKKILVVDDEEEVVGLLERRLQKENYEVITATQGKEAILKAQKRLPDLILMDIVLPDLDGADVVKFLKDDPSTSKIPVLFLSGIVSNGGNGDKRADIKVGGQNYQAISKPFNFEQLLVEIKNHIK